MKDTRIEELDALALEEGIHLPIAANVIAFLEQQGYVVDLATGEVFAGVTVAVTPSAQALCHLYGVTDDDITAIFAPAAEDALELDLFDYEGELEDYQEWTADQDFWRSGRW